MYAFNKPDRQEHCVVFWDTKNGEVSHNELNLVSRFLSIESETTWCRERIDSSFILRAAIRIMPAQNNTKHA